MKGTHLTLEDRKMIQHGLEEGLSKARIAKDIGKSPSTVSKEVRLHRKFKLTSAYQRGVRYYCASSGQFKECYGCKTECEHLAAKGENALAYVINARTMASAIWTNITIMLQKHTKNIFTP